MDADITVFDPATVVDRATFAQPAQASGGIPHVIVNGTFVLRGREVDRRRAAWGARFDGRSPAHKRIGRLDPLPGSEYKLTSILEVRSCPNRRARPRLES
jgi:hypothetical protein